MTSSYMHMIQKNMLRKEFTTKEDWLEDIFTNSNPEASLQAAETALRTFDIFCKVKVGLDNTNIIDLEEYFTEDIPELESKELDLTED
jgi:hypothetical protein